MKQHVIDHLQMERRRVETKMQIDTKHGFLFVSVPAAHSTVIYVSFIIDRNDNKNLYYLIGNPTIEDYRVSYEGILLSKQDNDMSSIVMQKHSPTIDTVKYFALLAKKEFDTVVKKIPDWFQVSYIYAKKEHPVWLNRPNFKQFKKDIILFTESL